MVGIRLRAGVNQPFFGVRTGSCSRSRPARASVTRLRAPPGTARRSAAPRSRPLGAPHLRRGVVGVLGARIVRVPDEVLDRPVVGDPRLDFADLDVKLLQPGNVRGAHPVVRPRAPPRRRRPDVPPHPAHRRLLPPALALPNEQHGRPGPPCPPGGCASPPTAVHARYITSRVALPETHSEAPRRLPHFQHSIYIIRLARRNPPRPAPSSWPAAKPRRDAPLPHHHPLPGDGSRLPAGEEPCSTAEF